MDCEQTQHILDMASARPFPFDVVTGSVLDGGRSRSLGSMSIIMRRVSLMTHEG